MSSPQGSIALTQKKKIEKMTIPEKDKTGMVFRALENVSKDIPLYMLWREAFHNEFDAIIMKHSDDRSEIYIDPFHNDSDGSILFAGTGIGFTEEIVINNFNSMFNSSKVNELALNADFDQCKGIGIKAAGYKRADLEYKTKNFNNSFKFKFTSDDEGFPGLEKTISIDEDGDEVDESIVYIDNQEFSFLKEDQTGTELVMKGVNGANLSETLASEIHSLFGSKLKKLNKQYGWAFCRFLNMRYWSFPENINIDIKVGPERKERVRGSEYYLKNKSIDNGTKMYSLNTGFGSYDFKLRWFIMKEDMGNHHAIYCPFFAIKHKSELYGNLAPGASRAKLMRDCGLSRASDRIVFVVEFEDCCLSVPNSRKQVTIDGHDIDVGKICEVISENLPEKVQKFKDELINSIPPDELIMKSLRNFLRENYYFKKSPALRLVNSTQVSDKSLINKPKEDQTSANKNKQKSIPKGVRNPQSNRKAKSSVQNFKLPELIADPTMSEDIWAHMNVKQWELTYNPNFKDIEEMQNLTTMVEFSNCPNTRKNVVLGALLGKSVEWIFNQVYKNIKERDYKLQQILNEQDLTKQAWLSSGTISRQKKSESSK